MHPITARIAPAALAAVLAVSLSACAAQSPGSADTSAKSSSQAAEAEQSASLEPGEFMDRIIAAQTEAGSFRMSMDMSSVQAGAVDASMRYDNGDGNMGMSLTMDASGEQLSMVLVGGQTYLSMASLTGDRYLQISPDDADNPFRALADQVSTTDPVEQANDVRDAATSVTLIGTEELDGTAAEHYEVVVDPAKVTGATAEQLAASVADLDEIVYHYWLDDEGRPLQVSFSVELQGTEVGSTVQMRDWGAVEPIVAPAGGQLVSFEELGLAG